MEKQLMFDISEIRRKAKLLKEVYDSCLLNDIIRICDSVHQSQDNSVSLLESDVTKENFILLEDIRLYGMPYTIRTKAIRLENDGKGCITVDFKRH